MNDTQQLGRYELLRELGRGAMGVVYVANDPHLQRTVAIKTIRIGGLANQASAEYERRFLTEARSAARLSHPAIVSVYDAGRDTDVTYLVMEYISGINLKYCLRQGVRFSVVGAVRILLDVLSALEHAHTQRVVHRDIKPENILLDVLGTIKLTDFGIARIQDGPDNGTMVSGLSIGTPRYMSPEQVQGQEVDARSDLFSAGVMLYELLTSTLPFDGGHPMAVVAKILHVAHTPAHHLRPEVPLAVSAVVDKALNKNTAQRFQSAQAFSAALLQACQEGGLPLERMTQMTGGNSAVSLVESDSVPTLLWLLQGAPDPSPAQDPPGATTGASLAAYAATVALPSSPSTSTTSAPTRPSADDSHTAPTIRLEQTNAHAGKTNLSVFNKPSFQDNTNARTSQLAWQNTTGPTSGFPPTMPNPSVLPPAPLPAPTASPSSVPRWWPALLLLPVLGGVAWWITAQPPAPPPPVVTAPAAPSEPKEEVISTTSSAPLTPGAVTPPPLTPVAPPASAETPLAVPTPPKPTVPKPVVPKPNTPATPEPTPAPVPMPVEPPAPPPPPPPPPPPSASPPPPAPAPTLRPSGRSSSDIWVN